VVDGGVDVVVLDTEPAERRADLGVLVDLGEALSEQRRVG